MKAGSAKRGGAGASAGARSAPCALSTYAPRPSKRTSAVRSASPAASTSQPRTTSWIAAVKSSHGDALL